MTLIYIWLQNNTFYSHINYRNAVLNNYIYLCDYIHVIIKHDTALSNRPNIGNHANIF